METIHWIEFVNDFASFTQNSLSLISTVLEIRVPIYTKWSCVDHINEFEHQWS